MKFLVIVLLFLIDLFGQSAQGRGSRVSDFWQDCSQGSIKGHTCVTKFGENLDIDGGSVPETVWKLGGSYTWPTGPDTLFFSSSSSADDSIQLLITGLGEDSLFRTDSINLDFTDGQTKVKCCSGDSSSWYRVFRVHVHNFPKAISGEVYAYHPSTVSSGVPTDLTKVLAYIDNGDNQTQQMVYTVPCDSYGYYWGGLIMFLRNNVNNKSADGSIKFRGFNEPWRVRFPFSVISNGGALYHTPPWPRELEPCTDIEMEIDDVSDNNTRITAEMYILTIDTNYVRKLN